MTTYISILRGINVRGHKLIKMDALRKSYQDLGFQRITTYVQSGNVVFITQNAENGVLEQKISRQINDVFGFEVPAIVLPVDRLQQIVDANPFLGQPEKEKSFLHVTFLSAVPSGYDRELIEVSKQGAEELLISEYAVYLYCPDGYGNSKLSNTFFEKKLKVAATTRNWKTTNELLKIALQTL